MDTQEARTYYAVLIAAVVIGIIILYFIISVVKHQRRLRLLYRDKVEAEVRTLEKERLRVAFDLHDELGPTLSATKFKITNIETIDAEDEKSKTEAMSYIDNMLEQIRYIANGLVPNVLLMSGPVAAIKEYIERTATGGELRVILDAKDFPHFEQDRQVHLYRILQEIIHNTLKHARASTLHIVLRPEKNMLLISTADNGSGFHLPGRAKVGGMGLNNLRIRTDMLAGKMYLETKPGKGTRFTFHIPLHPKPEHR